MLLCVASGNPTPSYTWYKDNVQVQHDADKSNYTITSANRNHAGTYRCQAVVSAPGLGSYRTDYTVRFTVRCKFTLKYLLSTYLTTHVLYIINNKLLLN